MPAIIEFHGTQRQVTAAEKIEMPVSAATGAKEALNYVRQRYPQLNLEDGLILITINLEIANPDRILKDGDVVSFLPIIGGG